MHDVLLRRDAPGTLVPVSLATTLYGVVALTFMMAMYALENRGRRFVLAFAAGCVLSAVYGVLSGAWPFGVVELTWSAIAVERYRRRPVGSRRP
jgi:hypothetical protein